MGYLRIGGKKNQRRLNWISCNHFFFFKENERENVDNAGYMCLPVNLHSSLNVQVFWIFF